MNFFCYNLSGDIMDKDRLIHSYNVGKKMMEIGKKYNLTNDELEELFILGLNHDIGYEFGEGSNHNKTGGEILKKSNYKYYKEVYYHGEITCDYSSLNLDASVLPHPVTKHSVKAKVIRKNIFFFIFIFPFRMSFYC